MKIFGFNFGPSLETPITTSSTALVLYKKDQSPTIRPELKIAQVPEAKRPANIVPIKSNTLSYASINSNRGLWSTCEYDLALINRISDTDSFVHQAFVKKTGLMFKEGYEIVGPDPQTIQYIKLRLAQIARATNFPTDELFRSIGSSLITKSNAFLVKARKESASGGRIRTIPGTERQIQPIAGYFLVPAETMSYEANEFGKILRWKQELPDSKYLYFKPEDVVHLFFNRKEGFIFGTPTITPVVDDIRSLRKIEENIELLVYQHLFPLFHYKIGSDSFPATIDENGNDEIEVAKTEIQHMPAEGGLVTSHRHEVQLVGAENRSLRAEGYLQHFKKRVFSGLGISAVDMGEGECYSADTQTLTENGWKYHWQIDHLSEKIATYNPRTCKIEFHIANYKHESNYKGPMIHVQTPTYLDILVTPKHDMWFKSLEVPPLRSDENWVKIQAQDLIHRKVHGKLLLSATFTEENSVNLIDQQFIEPWTVVLGYVMANSQTSSGLITITAKNPNKAARHPLTDALTALDIPFNVDKTYYSEGRQWLQVSFPQHVWDSSFIEYNNFNINKLLELPIHVRKLITHSFLLECSEKHGTARDEPVYRYTGPYLDQVQLLVISAGYLAVVKTDSHGKDYLYVNCKHKSVQSAEIFLDNLSVVSYEGTIYCYNVPNHLFVTRRNGKITIQGNTATRSTSDNMSRNLIDSVKDIQRVLECQVSEFIFNELLLESTFGSDVLDESHRVYLKFKEIDLDHQIKKEAHYADQFNKNVISQHEARIGMGRQPMRIPTPEEIESGDPLLADKYPEWFAIFWKLIDEPKSLIQAIDEPATPTAKAAAANRSTSLTTSQNEEAASESIEQEEQLIKARPAPVKRRDSLQVQYHLLQEGTINSVNQRTYSTSWFKQLAFSTESQMIRELNTLVISSFLSGYRSINNTNQQLDAVIRVRPKLESRINFYINRLIKHTIQALSRQNIDTLENDVKIQKIKSAFDALAFRNDFIEDIEIRKAFNLGIIEAGKDMKIQHWTLDIPVDACHGCQSAAQRIMDTNLIDLDEVPPLHPNSRSKIKLVNS